MKGEISLNKRILVVEDDVQIQELIVEFLKAENYNVDSADDGILGYKKFKESNYDLIILDVMMPNLDGYGLCKMIRNSSNVPIIFLTALGEEQDEVKAFQFKADDFIQKPFSFNVLIRRVEAVLRRATSEGDKKENLLIFENLTLNKETYKCFYAEEEVDLTLKEFNILKLFVEFYPKVVTREILMDKVWGYDYYGEMRVIDAHIKNIRKKFKGDYIKTVKGIGYVLEKKVE